MTTTITDIAIDVHAEMQSICADETNPNDDGVVILECLIPAYAIRAGVDEAELWNAVSAIVFDN